MSSSIVQNPSQRSAFAQLAVAKGLGDIGAWLGSITRSILRRDAGGHGR